MRAPYLPLVLCALAALSGCTDRTFDPAYPAAIVSTDAGLAGSWRAQPLHAQDGPDLGAMTVTITPDRVVVIDDRLNPAVRPSRGAHTVEAYTITLEAQADPPLRVNMNAYRLSINGRDYLAGQVGLGQLTDTGLLPFIVPLHFIARIERDGDTLKLWNNEPSIAWMPLATPLDPPAAADGPPPLPVGAESSEHTIVITTSIDRIIELLRRPDADRLFCGEPIVLQRVEP